MHEVVLRVGVERVSAREVVERAVDLLEVPRVAERDERRADEGLGRYVRDVASHDAREVFELLLVQQLEPVDDERLVLEQRDCGAPPLPPRTGNARIERGAEETKSDELFAGHIL